MWKSVLALAVLSTSIHASEPQPEVSWLIGQDQGDPVIAQVWPSPSQGQRLLWRVISTTGTKLSEVTEPFLTSGYELSYGECTVAGKLRRDVIAEILTRPNSPVAVKVKRTWVLDPKSKSFRMAPIAHVVCYNADYGF